MDQVSRPLVIVLACVLALAALWLGPLRPGAGGGGDDAASPALPTKAIGQAEGASAASDAANAQVQAAAAVDGAAPAASAATPAAPAGAPATAAAAPGQAVASSARERAVLRDIRRDKVVVLLFWNSRAADDRAVRDAVAGLDRRGGKVAVHVAPVGAVGSYEAITAGVTIDQSPTTLVIGRAGETRAIVGLSEGHEIAQAVGDALAGR